MPDKKKPFVILLVLGSPQRSSTAFLQARANEAQLVIACDSGAVACMHAGIRVEVLIGDNDSLNTQALSYVRACKAQEVLHPVDKDKTDLQLALDYIEEYYLPHHQNMELVVSCASGGRPDHACAILGSLLGAQALHPRIEEDDYCCYLMSADWNNQLVFESQLIGHTVSVIAFENPTTITLHGMRWNQTHWDLPPLSDRGISNIVEASDAFLTVHKGSLACYIMRDIQRKTRPMD